VLLSEVILITKDLHKQSNDTMRMPCVSLNSTGQHRTGRHGTADSGQRTADSGQQDGRTHYTRHGGREGRAWAVSYGRQGWQGEGGLAQCVRRKTRPR